MSPFHTTGPITEDRAHLFVGRQAELALLHKYMNSTTDRYVIVLGARYTGKSSLLQQYVNTYKTGCTCMVSFPRSLCGSLSDVTGAICREILETLGQDTEEELARLPGPIEFSRWLKKHFPPTGNFLLILEELWSIPLDIRLSLASLLRGIYSAAQTDEPVFKRLNLILAGGIELNELAVIQTSPLQGVCKMLFLGDLSDDDVVKLVNTAMAGQELSEMDLQLIAHAIYNLLEGHPSLTQRLGDLIENALLQDKKPKLGTVARSAEELFRNDPYFIILRNGIKERGLECFCKELLERARPFSRSGWDNFEELELIGVAKNEDSVWAPRNPLIARALSGWLAQINTAAAAKQPFQPLIVQPLSLSMRGDLETHLCEIIDKLDHLESQVAGGVNDLKEGQRFIYQGMNAALMQMQLDLMSSLQDLQMSSAEMAGIVDASQRALKYMLSDSSRKEQAALQRLQDALDSSLELSGKFQLSIPIIPGFLTYSVELGGDSSLDLKKTWLAAHKAWRVLLDRYRSRNKET